MNKPPDTNLRAEFAAIALLGIGVVLSAAIVIGKIAESRRRLEQKSWQSAGAVNNAAPAGFQTLEATRYAAEHPITAGLNAAGLFVGELRVVAIGSAYPIPFEAEVCPFSNIPQPAMNRMDRDGDGMTDDWELKYGLNKHQASDAAEDRDGDGFSNLEEFQYGADPLRKESHPPFALKIRFVERKIVDFPLVFQGTVDLPNGERVYQLNTPADGKTHFKGLGEAVEGIVLQRFIEEEEGAPARLVVTRNTTEIELPRGQKTADPESEVELINILDQTPIMVTMGALLSLYDDEYTVHEVTQNKVVLKHSGTGEVFDIDSVAEEESKDSSEDL